MNDKKLEVRIKYHTDILPIEEFTNGDWVDLRVAEDAVLEAGEYREISLGISIQLPEGYEAHIVPRSSTCKKWGIIQANHMAVIDNSYRGDNDIWKYPVIAVRNTRIYKNDRICQFRIIKKQPKFDFVTMDHFDDPDRGGFGSTGMK